MLDRALLAFALVALATLVLLFLMTGSVVIPIKALLLNIVSWGRVWASSCGSSSRGTSRACSASSRSAPSSR